MIKRKFSFGFTLAEVLIVIAIIGIVAAMTLPSIITKYQKFSTANEVKKFYSMINQAIRQSSVDNGDVEGWFDNINQLLDSEVSGRLPYENAVKFLEEYMLPYIRYSYYESCYFSSGNEPGVCIHLSDGNTMRFAYDRNGGDISFFIGHGNDLGMLEGKKRYRNYFRFQFNKKANLINPDNNSYNSFTSKNFVQPYAMN